MHHRFLRFAWLCVFALALPALAQQDAAKDEGVSQGVGVVEAYQRLLKENLELRSQIGELTETAESKEQQRKQLSGTVSDLEKRILTLVRQIDKLRTDRSNQADPAELKGLQARMAEREKERDELTQRIADLTSQIATMDAAADATVAAPEATGPQVAPGSALYRQLEQENARLRLSIREMQSEKTEVERQAAIKDSAIEELESGQVARTAERDALLKLAKHLRRMQGEVRDLKDEVQTKESRLRREKERVALLENQIEERDDTIRKIKRIGELLDRVNEEQSVRQMPQMAQRDHYRRKGDKHFEAGEFGLARAAYHKALSLDESYADVHYNLGLLYDQHLGDPNRALMHYNAYVSLRPNAEDAALVRLWIREAEVAAPDEVPVAEPEEDLTFLLEQAMAPDGVDEAASTHRDFYIAQATAHSKQGRVKDAVTAYTRALEFDPDHAGVHYNLAVLYDDFLDQNEKAVQHYRRYLQLRPHAGDADRVKLWLREAELGI